MNTLSTHILDLSTGTPAAGVRVVLEQDGREIARAITGPQGRIAELVPSLAAGRYRLVALTGEWFAARGHATIYPCAQIDFIVSETADAHYHLPFVIAPGGWSTYRGS